MQSLELIFNCVHLRSSGVDMSIFLLFLLLVLLYYYCYYKYYYFVTVIIMLILILKISISNSFDYSNSFWLFIITDSSTNVIIPKQHIQRHVKNGLVCKKIINFGCVVSVSRRLFKMKHAQGEVPYLYIYRYFILQFRISEWVQKRHQRN